MKKSLSQNNIKEISAELTRGLVCVLLSDTIYGLSCDATNEEAVKKVFRIKKRRSAKLLIVLVSDLEMLKKYVYLNRRQELILRSMIHEDRPVTYILKSKNRLCQSMNQATLAVRIPIRKDLCRLISSLKRPIVSTSVNISGQQPIKKLKDIRQFKIQPDMIIDQGEVKNSKPSMILDICNPDSIKIIRV